MRSLCAVVSFRRQVWSVRSLGEDHGRAGRPADPPVMLPVWTKSGFPTWGLSMKPVELCEVKFRCWGCSKDLLVSFLSVPKADLEKYLPDICPKLVRERCFAKGYPFATPQDRFLPFLPRIW